MPSKSRSTLQQDTQKRRKDEQKLVEEDSESEGDEALDDESDVDAPRVVQWVDEDELEYEDGDDDEQPEVSKAGPSSLVRTF